jgi:citrate synthase
MQGIDSLIDSHGVSISAMSTSRIDNQHKGYISSREACKQLKIKAATLYSYVSRGLIGCVHLGGKKKLYSQEDVSRLQARSAANKGHTAVAAAALRWGEPVLDSAITLVEEGKIYYRGQAMSLLLSQQRSFEEVAALLLSCEQFVLSPATAPSTKEPTLSHLIEFTAQQTRAEQSLSPSQWVASFASLLGAQLAPGRSLAEALCVGYQVSPGAARALETALIVCADHELNVSTFAARVVASSGASTAACLLAALCAFSGKKHGAASIEIEAFLSLLEPLPSHEQDKVIQNRLLSGDPIPGFGHRLYQHRDPRTAPLLRVSRDLGSTRPRFQLLLRWLQEAEGAGHVPTVDAGLVAVTEALGLPPQSASVIFALGRTVGWLAHIEEQRTQPILLRPRARYIGL